MVLAVLVAQQVRWKVLTAAQAAQVDWVVVYLTAVQHLEVILVAQEVAL